MAPEMEWSFALVITPGPTAKDLRDISELLLAQAITWAEERSLGIGGGYKIHDFPQSQESAFNFGLTATRDNQWIPGETAQHLLIHLKTIATENGFQFKGHWKKFEDQNI